MPVALSISATFIAFLSFFLPVLTAEDTFDSLLRQGFELHQQRRYTQAIAPLERAHRLQPNDYFANLLLGIDYLRTGQAVKALSFLETASRAKPTDATALGYSAEAHAASGRMDLAMGALQAAKQRDPAPQWRAALIRLYLARFRAISHQLRLTRAGLARSYRLQARAMRERKDPKESDILLRAYSLSPDLEGIESELAHAEIRRQRFDLARRFLQQARARNPKDLDMMAAEAYLAAHQGDWEVAETKLRELGRQSRHRARAALNEWPDDVQLPDRLRHAVEQADASTPARVATSADVWKLFASQNWEAVTTGVSPGEAGPDELFRLGVAQARLKRFENAVAPLGKV